MSPRKLLDGVMPDVSRDAYDVIDRVNFSTLKWMRMSPAHYRQALNEESADTDARKCGRATHLLALEPDIAKKAIAVWDGGTRKGKDWDRFVEENVGRELLTLKEHERCTAIAAAVRADPIAKRYLVGGRSEVTQLWSMSQGGVVIPCKGRLDYVQPRAIVDLKVVRTASPDGFARWVWEYRAHTQAAWYQDGHEIASKKRLPYVLIAVESFAPFVVQVYLVPESILQLGREEYSTWLQRLVHCRRENSWPGYHDEELELTLPRYALGFEDGDDTDLTSELDAAGGLGGIDLITPAN